MRSAVEVVLFFFVWLLWLNTCLTIGYDSPMLGLILFVAGSIFLVSMGFFEHLEERRKEKEQKELEARIDRLEKLNRKLRSDIDMLGIVGMYLGDEAEEEK